MAKNACLLRQKCSQGVQPCCTFFLAFSSWQEAQWADHCGDYCAFVGYANWEDLEQQGIAESIEWLGLQPEPEDRPYIRNGGSMVGCLFRCLHCSQHILHVDLDWAVATPKAA